MQRQAESLGTNTEDSRSSKSSAPVKNVWPVTESAEKAFGPLTDKDTEVRVDYQYEGARDPGADSTVGMHHRPRLQDRDASMVHHLARWRLGHGASDLVVHWVRSPLSTAVYIA